MSEPSDPRFTFSDLIAPIEKVEFFDAIWERRPIVVARGTPDHYGDLLRLDDVDRVLSTLSLRPPEIRLVSTQNAPKSEDYTLADGTIDVLAASKLFAAGNTIVFNQMQRRIPNLRALCRQMETELGLSFQTNLYLSPPNSSGFKVHYDTHDVFVLQMLGHKEWKLFESPIALPFAGQHHDESGTEPGTTTHEFTLRQGDLAYIPRGFYHAANASRSESLHITLGALNRTWSEILIEAVSELSLRDPEFRRALPIGFGTRNFDTGRAATQFKALLERFCGAADFAAVMQSMTRDFAGSRSAGLSGHLTQMLRLGELSGETRIVARDGAIFLPEADEETLTLHYLNTAIAFPARAGEGVMAALSGTPLKVADIPGPLDLEGRLVLARRLIEEGLVQTV